MDVLRTPDDRFEGLEQWPYEPRWTEVGDGVRMHHVDEGPEDGPAVVLAHGEPTWGYLYRKMIPPLVEAGCRVLVPDLVGFGRSDKPAAREDYTYLAHLAWTGAWLDSLPVDDLVLFAQDWGGLLFLVHVGQRPERFRAVVAANTALPDPDTDPATVPPEAVAPFLEWLQWSQDRPELIASEVVGGDSPLNQSRHRLTPGEAAAYDAPFPDESFRSGARQFPLLVPIGGEDPSADARREAWAGLRRFEKPFVTAYAEQEDITRFFAGRFQADVPGAAGQQHVTVPGGHFLQEHSPAELAEVVLRLLR